MKELEDDIFDELEDIIEHTGVKGMKWGKRKLADIKERGKADKDVMRKRKNGELTRKQAKEEHWKNFHKHHSKNKKYKQSYDKRIEKGQAPKKAMRGAYNDSQRTKRIAMKLGSPVINALLKNR